MNRFVVLAAISVFGCASAVAQVFRPPPFISGVPGKAQMQAVEMQRHQARTLLYREAIEELRRNPAIVDIRECVDGGDDQSVCLPKFAGAAVPPSRPLHPFTRTDRSNSSNCCARSSTIASSACASVAPSPGW